MKTSSPAAAKSLTSKPLFSLSKKLNEVLGDLRVRIPLVPTVSQLLFQLSAIVGLIFFGTKMFDMIGVAGPGAFLETAFSGLIFDYSSFAFTNGTIAIVVLLLFTYSLLSVFLISPSRILCDAAFLLTLFYSANLYAWAFEKLVLPVTAIVLIWALHRLVLGTLVYRFKKLELSDNVQIKSSEGIAVEKGADDESR